MLCEKNLNQVTTWYSINIHVKKLNQVWDINTNGHVKISNQTWKIITNQHAKNPTRGN